jgi:transposase
MAKTRLPYAPEFRRQMVALVRAGRTPEELAMEFEPTAQSIRNWVAQSERNSGRGDGGLTTAEREELNRLRRENRQPRVEREILSKAAAWFARKTNAIPAKGPGFVSDHQASRHHVQAAGCLLQSSSGYYAWVQRPPSRRAEADETL